ncbi:MAG TPA: hypothetical protein VD758_01530, partial [Gemmatimonadaceae bacterium]|nr:hypothetical protein [Gemmatimonadaceae bacterium]
MTLSMAKGTRTVVGVAVFILTSIAWAASVVQGQATPSVPSTLKWRNIGPNRGGRSIAAAGSAARPSEYYFGATGGGLWKTIDGGI